MCELARKVTAGTQYGMCKLARNGTTGAQHGMCEVARHGTAGAQHGMCELARRPQSGHNEDCFVMGRDVVYSGSILLIQRILLPLSSTDNNRERNIL